MSAGLLNALFATSTVAAGVEFPARTVVISNADTRGNDGWRPLTACMAWLAKWPPLARLEAAIRGVSPRWALVLFIVPATLLNKAGVVGAALYATEEGKV